MNQSVPGPGLQPGPGPLGLRGPRAGGGVPLLRVGALRAPWLTRGGLRAEARRGRMRARMRGTRICAGRLEIDLSAVCFSFFLLLELQKDTKK